MLKKLFISLASLAVFSMAFAQDVTLPKEVYASPGPHVVVNGNYLKAQLVSRNGSLLLPMRTVFEALEAKIAWDGATQKITATRGTVVVTLWLNKAVGMINDKQVILSTPPSSINNMTYVPLRFPAEAFGGEIKWYDKLQTAAITIAPVAAATVPVAAPITVTGTLVDKMSTPVMALLVKTAADAEPKLVQITKAATFTRTLSIDPQVKTAKFDDLQAGDQIVVTLDKSNNGIQVAAVFSTLTDKLAGLANKKLLMADGKLYSLNTDAIIVDTNGKTMKDTDVKPGDTLTLSLVPNTTNIWKMVLPAAPVVVIPPVVTLPTTVTKAFIMTLPTDKGTFSDTVIVTGEATAGTKVNITIKYEVNSIVKIASKLYESTVTTNDKGVWTTDAIKTTVPFMNRSADILTIVVN
ncbi:MAG: copper amine oxidase N-terminal domain-containing protein, partial [bacterium]